MKRRMAYGCAVFVVSYFVCAPAGRAWGCRGHETIAALAEKHLTPEAKQALLALLTANPIDPQLKRFCGERGLDPIVDAATWADDERTKEPATAAWHFIDIPLGANTRDVDTGTASAPFWRRFLRDATLGRCRFGNKPTDPHTTR